MKRVYVVFSLLVYLSAWGGLPTQNAHDPEDCRGGEVFVCNEEFVNDCWCETSEPIGVEFDEERVNTTFIGDEERRQIEAKKAALDSLALSTKSINTKSANPKTETKADSNSAKIDAKKTSQNTLVADVNSQEEAVSQSDFQQATSNREIANCRSIEYQMEDLQEQIKECTRTRSNTSTYCEAGGSQTINNALSAVQNIARTITLGGAISQQAACSEFANYSNIALGAIGAYRAACAPVKKICEDECKKAIKSYTALKKEINRKVKVDGSRVAIYKEDCSKQFNAFKTNFEKLHDPRKSKNSKKSIFSAKKACEGFGKDLLLAGVDAGAIFASVKNAESCDEEVAEAQRGFCELNPTSPVCEEHLNAANCSANPTSVFCICQTNPSDPVCQTLGGSSSPTSAGSVAGGSSVSQVGTDFLNDDSNGVNTDSTGDSTSLSSSIGGARINPVGGGNAGGGGGAKVKAIPNGSSAKLAGGGGGGSGRGKGRSRAGRGGTSSGLPTLSNGFARTRRGSYAFKPGKFYKRGQMGSEFRNRPRQRHQNTKSPGSLDLKKYLPGGSLDPNRGRHISSASDGITGAMGPSLFEKITRRYHLVSDGLYQDTPKFRYPIERR